MNISSIYIDNFAPVKQLRIKQRTEPWVDSDILQAIKDRDSSFNKYRINKTEENFNTFKVLRNKVQNLVHNAKKDVFTNSIDKNKNDSYKDVTSYVFHTMSL